MTFRVGILGIDGSGKSTLVEGLEQRLSTDYSVLSIGQRVTLYSGAHEPLELLARLPATSHPLRHLFRNMQRHWTLQRLPALLKKYRPDICLEDRDGCIDLCALTTAHFPALRFIAPRHRVEILLALTRRSLADMYLFLRVPAGVAEERIQRKLQQTRRLRALHESLPCLDRVAAEYSRFLDYLKQYGVPVAVLDACQPASSVLAAACPLILQTRHATPAVSTQSEKRNKKS